MASIPSTSNDSVDDVIRNVPRSTVIQNALPWLEVSSSYEGRVV